MDSEIFVAFAGEARIASGPLADVAAAVRRYLDRDDGAVVLVFDAITGKVRDLDLRGTEAEVRVRHAPEVAAATRGRPKLGVTAKEVTLLPRHWDWLAAQPGGASVTLRRLVEAASRTPDPAAELRTRREAAYRFMSAMAGDRPRFEDAARALFSGDDQALAQASEAWPPDIRSQLQRFLEMPGA